MSSETRRQELGALLRSRRDQLTAADLGLPAGARRRSPGLRREEVAALSGVSVTWYTWLEQGRDTHPSRQVLDALARTLRLSDAEHAYVLSLAGHPAPRPSTTLAARTAPASLQRLLDAQVGLPAFAITSGWQIAGWNAAYAVLYPGIATVADEDRNLLWLVFTDPSVRQLLPRWEEDSRRFLAEFRAEAGPLLGEPAVAALVQRLRAASAHFEAGWTDHDVRGFTSRERLFHHPDAGDLRFEHHQLTPADHPDLQVVIYTPIGDGRTPALWTTLLPEAPGAPGGTS
ncbi:helix-turn-helix transcriptional regulator [Paenibacillus sp. TRM 82003]|uniref:helix-turn-helix transcriptional regulator n=1 Tax=Kineococcus sp. TRM81007 TaxID=2925831 RepID=UPI001F586AAE|nr:helix-turn-helix transcriptional regulator [Kineococcus sp. TRM81007]MCI2237304.1 helix-turn-helix transcriptional regulator [Kineococcus sp. TRM81007]MCI3919363.1 helix-turn-helix transcriptional regulator [Paenibacillus sp. TRM 82003]